MKHWRRMEKKRNWFLIVGTAVLFLVLILGYFNFVKFGDFNLSPSVNRVGRGVLEKGVILGEGTGTRAITVGFTASRGTGGDTCVAPCAVFFDATGTTSTTTTRPFHDLYYFWNFGDLSSGTWATNGKSKNYATGAVAAHVFEPAAGEYDSLTHKKNYAVNELPNRSKLRGIDKLE